MNDVLKVLMPTFGALLAGTPFTQKIVCGALAVYIVSKVICDASVQKVLDGMLRKGHAVIQSASELLELNQGEPATKGQQIFTALGDIMVMLLVSTMMLGFLAIALYSQSHVPAKPVSFELGATRFGMTVVFLVSFCVSVRLTALRRRDLLRLVQGSIWGKSLTLPKIQRGRAT
jgi:hypothetical protein